MDTETNAINEQKQVTAFLKANKSAFGFLRIGVEDYIACRCLLLNGVIPQGLTLAAQSVEKVMKFHYLIRGGTKDVKVLGHIHPNIANELKNDPTINFNLSSFQQLFERLEDYYFARYPDDWDKILKNKTNWSFSTNEIDEIDELFFHLSDNLPAAVSNEVKFSTGIYQKILNSLVFNENIFVRKDLYWLGEKNLTLSSNWSRIKTECEQLIKFLYPSKAVQ